MLTELKKANAGIDNFSRDAKKAAAGAKKAFMGLASALATGALASNIVNVAKEMETLRTAMEVAFKSTEKAALEFNKINQFAAKTPFTIQELTEATIKLKNLGLDPSISSLESLGNTASSIGKPLIQAVEAIADAARGEFERLKEFGIDASSQGDRVKFIFNGVATEVGKNAQEIEKYLLDIGNIQFAGAIEKQSKTLQGTFSTLEGAVDNLIVKFAEESGLTEALKDAAKGMTEFINKISTGRRSIASLEADIKKLETTVTKQTARGQKEFVLRYGQEIPEENLKRIKEIRLEIDKIQAEAGDLEAAERVIGSLNEKISALRETLTGGPLTERMGSSRRETLTEEGKTTQRIEALQAEIGLLEQIKSLSLPDAAGESEENQVDPVISRIVGKDPEASLERVKEYLMTEQEAIENAYSNRNIIIENAKAKDLINEDKYNKLVYKNRKKYLDELEKLERIKQKKQEEGKQKFYNNVISLTNSGSRTLFEIGKGSALALAVLNAKESIVSSYAAGSEIGGPPLGALYAAAAAAAQFANINAIRSTSFGSGAGSGSSIASASGVSVSDTLEASDELASDQSEDKAITKTVTINVSGIEEGALVSKETIRAIADQINEESSANVKIML